MKMQMDRRGFIKTAGLGALVLMGLSGCKEEFCEMSDRCEVETDGDKVFHEIRIEVGESISPGSPEKVSGTMRHCGMPSDDRFVLSGTSRVSVPLWYDVKQKKIKFQSDEFEVIEVTPREIVLRYEI